MSPMALLQGIAMLLRILYPKLLLLLAKASGVMGCERSEKHGGLHAGRGGVREARSMGIGGAQGGEGRGGGGQCLFTVKRRTKILVQDRDCGVGHTREVLRSLEQAVEDQGAAILPLEENIAIVHELQRACGELWEMATHRNAPAQRRLEHSALVFVAVDDDDGGGDVRLRRAASLWRARTLWQRTSATSTTTA